MPTSGLGRRPLRRGYPPKTSVKLLSRWKVPEQRLRLSPFEATSRTSGPRYGKTCRKINKVKSNRAQVVTNPEGDTPTHFLGAFRSFWVEAGGFLDKADRGSRNT